MKISCEVTLIWIVGCKKPTRMMWKMSNRGNSEHSRELPQRDIRGSMFFFLFNNEGFLEAVKWAGKSRKQAEQTRKLQKQITEHKINGDAPSVQWQTHRSSHWDHQLSLDCSWNSWKPPIFPPCKAVAFGLLSVTKLRDNLAELSRMLRWLRGESSRCTHTLTQLHKL